MSEHDLRVTRGEAVVAVSITPLIGDVSEGEASELADELRATLEAEHEVAEHDW